MKFSNIKISLTNSKLGGFIPSINLPPVITCVNCNCTKKCYATKGNYRFANVRKSMQDNLNAYKSDPANYFDNIIDFLNNGLIIYKYFRFHAAGDIVDQEYFAGVVRVAESCPQTNFLIFTKKYGIINKFIDEGGIIPDNLKVIFSAWDRALDTTKANRHGLPVAYVELKDNSNPIIPQMAIPCRGNCESCFACWGLHNGQCVKFKEH